MIDIFAGKRLTTKIIIVLLVSLLMTQATMSSYNKASAAAPLAFGAIPIGALAFWGGAVLVASVGTAVGLDPSAMDAVRDFGKSAWDGASDMMRDSIAATLSAVEWSGQAGRHAISWTADQYNYLSQKWYEFFGASDTYVAVDDTSKLVVATATGTILPSAYTWVRPASLSNPDIGQFVYGNTTYHVTTATAEYLGIATINYWTEINGRYDSRLAYLSDIYPGVGNVRFANAAELYNYLIDVVGLHAGMHTVEKKFYAGVGTGATTQITPSYPASTYGHINMPNIRGTLNSDGTVKSYTYPTIGHVGGDRTKDVAIGYTPTAGNFNQLTQEDTINPPMLEDFVVTGIPLTGIDVYAPDMPIIDLGIVFTPSNAYNKGLDIVVTPPIAVPEGLRLRPIANGEATIRISSPAISKTIEIPLVITGVSNPPAEGERPNDNWPDTLGRVITTRFPFSLPWDFVYLVNLFVADPQVPVIKVDTRMIKFSVTLNQLDPYLPFFRAIFIAMFLIGLTLKTRSLLGGSK